MAISICLLLVLQFFWLRSAYHEALEAFRKETNALFRSTLINLKDSLIIKGLERVPIVDSVQVNHAPGDFTRIIWDRLITRDSPLSKAFNGKKTKIEVRDSVIEVFITMNPKGDSVNQVIRPLLSEVRRRREPGRFILRLTADSLRVKDIQRAYTDTLNAVGIVLKPTVKKLDSAYRLSADAHAFVTEPFFLPHTPVYQAHFGNIQPMLLAKISPQITFSIILTLVTITAFAVMYRSMNSQQKLMQLKSELISNITHELKTPVATVSVALEALKNFNVLNNPQLTQEYVQIAQNELNRLTLMTEKILTTSAIEEKAGNLQTEEVDFGEIINRVLSSLKLVFEKKMAKVDFKKHGADFRVTGNTEHLTNMVYNLLDNAIKYSKPGCEIDVELREENHQLVLSVADNGIGIPEEYQEKIFEKFFRVPQGDVHNAKGYGLGLSYVASVVKQHGGVIRVESKLGNGSRFVVTMPSSDLA